MVENREDYPQIMVQLQAQAVLLARIDERQEKSVEHLERINGNITKLWAGLSDTKQRVGKLEQWRSYIAGALAAWTAAVAAWLGIRGER